jgi:delta-lactam-biosynthetic de-N-acetylase
MYNLIMKRNIRSIVLLSAVIFFITSLGIFYYSGSRDLTRNNDEDNELQSLPPTPVIDRDSDISKNRDNNGSDTNPPPLVPDNKDVQMSKQEIVRGDTSKDQIILTFDAGSGIHSATKILNTLKKNNIKSTFFLTGKWAEQNPQLVRRMHDEGHEIYNHTYNHPYMTKISDGDIVNELRRTDSIVSSITGTSTKPFFRPPYGDRNAQVLDVAFREGYRSVYWTIDALDWKEEQGITEEEVKDRIFSNITPGAIFLLHIGDNISGNILEEVILTVRSKGFEIVSLTEGL